MEITIRFAVIFNKAEEQKSVSHISYTAEIGCGYNAPSIKGMAKDYVDSLGKTKIKAKESSSNNWFYGFVKSWPNLKAVKPQKLSIAHSK